ncbi:MAG: PrgI family protein [Clostridia bacterium]|nr:PrgI family protein [Clostridia bacterium]
MAHSAYVPISKDLSQVKTKILFNLTARQLICFGSGILVGLPLFFLLNNVLPSSAAVIVMICVVMPFFFFGMYERNGQPLEKVLHYYIQSRFIRPKKRPYKTENVHSALMKQAQIEKEVNRIVQGAK